MKKIALYDIDYTIISINSLSEFIFFMMRKYPLKFFYFVNMSFLFFLWLPGIISTRNIKEYFLKFFEKMSVDEVSDLAGQFFDSKILPRIKNGVMDNINKFRDEGYKIVLATASFDFYLEKLIEYINPDYFFSTKVKIQDNTYVAKIDGKNCRDKEKINIILNVINESEIDKKNSVSYSDSKSDLPFLEITGQFNLVSRKKWHIIKTITNS